MKNPLQLLTVGNPNSGKTSLFNALTGSKQHVGNWPGVTVDRKTGAYAFNNQQVDITDLPGLYSLEHTEKRQSIDYTIAIKSIINLSKDETIVNVVDATNLERNLYLTLQLRELQCRMVVVINKIDLLEYEKQSIDVAKIEKILGCPVFTVSSHSKKQVNELKDWLNDLHQQGIKVSPFQLDYGKDFEPVINEISNLLNNNNIATNGCDSIRSDAIRFLLSDTIVEKQLANNLITAKTIRNNLAEISDIDIQIADVRYTYLHNLCQSVRLHHGINNAKLTQKIDDILLHRYFGIPCFLFIMYLMFMFSINIGSAFIDFFDISVGAILVDGGHYLLDNILPQWALTLLIDGAGAGIQTVATFIPVIFFLYLFMSLLESTGYMARAAFVLDKLMQKIGLPGKAFVPLILGFGCNVPSIMATRTLEHVNERRLTGAMVPFMSCGARLPVYALFAAAFFPNQAQNVVFGLYLLGIIVAILTGLFLRYSIFPVQSHGMVMEMPNYEIPTVQYIWIKTMHKLKRFMFGAGKVIVIGVTILSFLNSLGTDGSFGNNNTGKSLLATTAKSITPVLSSIGVTDDNWQATVGIITGVLAKEAVVGTLNTLYSQENNETKDYDLSASLQEAFKSIPKNLLNMHYNDPLNMNVGDTSNLDKAAEEQAVNTATFGNLQKYFVSESAAFAYLIFILLYTPCLAALGAYSKEFGYKYTGFVAFWTLLMAYTWATSFYQLSHFAIHPMSSILWISFFAVIISIIFFILKNNKKVFDENIEINMNSAASKPSCH